ncbi:MAG: acyl-CoA dehydrogenase, partial [Pseudomonadota bacterium]
QIEALEVHGSEELKALYLPKLTSGEWTGTMNLTEPQAGSDVGALSSKAEPRGDGTYAVTGQKIYISWGDHDIAENVVHLVLARLPGAPAGTRGLSLFLVPKRIPDAEGRAGVANAVRTVSLEHKMGLHGSPTAVMAFEGATGWLVGEEGAGIACMFTMMNNARLSVGIEGVGIAETALQAATAWARDRRQGRTADGTDTIIGHADVRRMLMSMMAQTRIARALCYDCALALDMGRAAEDAAGRAAEAARGAFLTPIAKAFGTYTGMEVADLAIQVHGGMGYIEEAGVAQLARDVRVTAIYEGTNGIQAMDLVGRKLAGDGGAAAQGVLADVTATVEAARAAGETVLADRLDAARVKLEGVTSWMLESEANDRAAGAAPYLRMWALVLGGHYLLRSALSGGSVERALAGFFVSQVLPQAHALAQAAVDGAEALYAIEAEAFGA